MAPISSSAERGDPPERWGSGLGFVLAAAGSAVGLGNLWGFAYRASQGGGAAFVLLYLLIVVLVCLPVLVAEMVLGRSTGHAPLLAPITAGGRRWKPLGWLFMAAAVGILSYYAVLMGWTGRSLFHALLGPLPTDIGAAQDYFTAISSGGDAVLGYLFSLALTGLVVAVGIRGGIERLSRWGIPLLFLLLTGLALWAAALPEARQGYATFLLRWDASKLTDLATIRNAFTQAFFSIGTGIGAILAYAAYLDRRSGIPGEAAAVVSMDTAVGLMAGCVTFPVVASFGLGEVVSGSTVGALFIALPTGLASLGGGGPGGGRAVLRAGLHRSDHLVGVVAGGACKFADGPAGLESPPGRVAVRGGDRCDWLALGPECGGAGADGRPVRRRAAGGRWPGDGPAAGLACARALPS
jgi:NSS family neurotransmitter:Na+ symporter